MTTSNFDPQTHKCVLIIDNTLPYGIIANAASVLSITLGAKIKDLISQDIIDKDGVTHLGITQFPIPILGTTKEHIKEIREKMLLENQSELVFVDFSDLAQQSKTYDEYTDKLQTIETQQINYLGIGICTKKKVINKATGNLSLIR